jgi:hypothetical protein
VFFGELGEPSGIGDEGMLEGAADSDGMGMLKP